VAEFPEVKKLKSGLSVGQQKRRKYWVGRGRKGKTEQTVGGEKPPNVKKTGKFVIGGIKIPPRMEKKGARDDRSTVGEKGDQMLAESKKEGPEIRGGRGHNLTKKKRPCHVATKDTFVRVLGETTNVRRDTNDPGGTGGGRKNTISQIDECGRKH